MISSQVWIETWNLSMISRQVKIETQNSSWDWIETWKLIKACFSSFSWNCHVYSPTFEVFLVIIEMLMFVHQFSSFNQTFVIKPDSKTEFLQTFRLVKAQVWYPSFESSWVEFEFYIQTQKTLCLV